MKRSINEIAGIALKAARGAGVPLGHAEDFSRAVNMLACGHDVDGLRQASAALDDPHGSPQLSTKADPVEIAQATAIMAMPVACDLLQTGARKVVLKNCAELRLAQAYCAGMGATADQEGADIVVTAQNDKTKRDFAGPCAVPDEIWAVFASYAAKTFVPETEESRLSGAGAGLTDND